VALKGGIVVSTALVLDVEAFKSSAVPSWGIISCLRVPRGIKRFDHQCTGGLIIYRIDLGGALAYKAIKTYIPSCSR